MDGQIKKEGRGRVGKGSDRCRRLGLGCDERWMMGWVMLDGMGWMDGCNPPLL
jgi:hypothetical protein